MSRRAQTIDSIINIQSAGRDVAGEWGGWILRLSAVISEAVYITEEEAGSHCGSGTLKGIHKLAPSLRRPSGWSRSVPLSDRRQPSKHCCWFRVKIVPIKSVPYHYMSAVNALKIRMRSIGSRKRIYLRWISGLVNKWTTNHNNLWCFLVIVSLSNLVTKFLDSYWERLLSINNSSNWSAKVCLYLATS